MTATIPREFAASSSEDRLLPRFIVLLLAVQLASLATFNMQPSVARLGISSLSLVGYAVLVLLSARHARPATLLHWTGLGLFVGAGLIALARNPRAEAASLISDMTAPMVLGLLTLRHTPAPTVAWLRPLWGLAIVVAIATAALALLGEPYVHAGAPRPALFAGGPDGLHPSAYATLCFFMLIFVLMRARVGIGWVSVLTLGLGAFVILEYQVRTAWTMLLVFGGVAAAGAIARRSPMLTIGAVGLGLLGAAVGLAILSHAHIDLGSFSSGRTLIYSERLGMIEARPPMELLFGSGSGTDLMRGVSAWRWGDKNSHNDFLQATVELGLVGLLGYLVMLAAVLWALPGQRKAWLLMFAVSSAISNGVLFRPSIGPVLVMVAYLSLAFREQELAAQVEAADGGFDDRTWT